MQRPTGITIMAILAAIGGVFGIFGSFPLLAIGLGFMALLSLIIGAGNLLFAYGAWFLKPWGWMVGVGFQAAAILQAVVNLFRTGDFFSFLILAAISGIILYYLFSPEVKRAFGRP